MYEHEDEIDDDSMEQYVTRWERTFARGSVDVYMQYAHPHGIDGAAVPLVTMWSHDLGSGKEWLLV